MAGAFGEVSLPRRALPETGDIIIVGAGLAGLFLALKLAPMAVTVVSSAPVGVGASSAWAQGGLAAAVGEGDTAHSHAADTVAAGAGIVDEAVAALTAREAAGRIDDLLRYGVPFDRDLEGRLALAREAAHSHNRIVHVRGDRAGAAIMAALVAAAKQQPSIRLIENVEAQSLLTADGGVVGVRVAKAGTYGRGPHIDLKARAVVLSTGGIGQLYAVTTNPREARGEGLAMAARAGAVIADAEFVQFHPTAIATGADPAPLATEALRGEGAVLVNARGERFMRKVHPDAELAPRDVVARAVYTEIVAGRGAFLDCRKAIGAAFPERFPTVYLRCKEAGIDPVRERIPVAPAAHYHMGGVLTDIRGRTSVDGLWAAGEVASTGLHGANRLASNSLLEAVVFAARIAEDIAGAEPRRGLPQLDLPDMPTLPLGIAHGERELSAIRRLREVMTRHVGVIRNAEGLQQALGEILAIRSELGGARAIDNMLLTAEFVTVAALIRTESRGAHFRSDFPKQRDDMARRSILTLRDVERLREQGGRIASLNRRAESP